MTSAPYPVYPVLYSFRRCPYAMRARLALAASGQICALREVLLARKPASLLDASAKGTVPVLVHADGLVEDQSLDIMLWALRRNDPLHWLPVNGGALMEAMGLVARCDGEFKFQLDRYKYPYRHGVSDAASHREQGGQFLGDLAARLSANRHLLGEHEGLADMAIAPFVRQFAHTDPAWFARQPWPALQSWLVTFENSALYQKVMTKYSPWEPGQAPVLFPDQKNAII